MSAPIEKEIIYQSSRSVVYKVDNSPDRTPFVLKTLASEYPEPEEIKRILLEYEFLHLVHHPNVVTVREIVKYKNAHALILEYFPAESLGANIHKFHFLDSLQIAVKILEGLNAIHAAGIIHKDLNPSNILVNPKTLDLKIIDFDISSFLQKDNQFFHDAKALHGTLPYISPEQTGRINRAIDYRSDYYSLGITLFQLFTGRLPFLEEDIGELIYSHIAASPPHPQELKPELPGIISTIILRLLEKSPEDRYQNTNYLLKDFRKCLSLQKEKGFISFFPISSGYSQEKFQIPDKLYGRDVEHYKLIRGFSGVSQGEGRVVVVNGVSGIGKTSLIKEVKNPLADIKGKMISGKYDQYKRDSPYRGFLEALRELVHLLLGESDESILYWRSLLRESIGPNIKLLSPFITNLELLTGELPELPTLPHVEEKNRFIHLLLNLIKVFSRKEHPLVFFLDDLQWADMSSLELLDSILELSDLQYFYLILSYRSNEVKQQHPLFQILTRSERSGLKIEFIELEPLGTESIIDLLKDTFHQDGKEVQELAEILYQKTHGTPYFLEELLKNLYKTKLIYYSESWKFDLEKIAQARISTNVLDFMVSKINDLEPAQIQMLSYAACIGNIFWLNVLSIILEIPLVQTSKEIFKLSNEGLLLVLGNEVKFVHDKVREAVYSLISSEEKSLLHYKIGNIYLNLANEENKLDEYLFTITNQLNNAIPCIDNHAEKTRLAELNVKSANRAMGSAAYDGALKFLLFAKNLLSDDSWKSEYSLCFKIYTLLAKAENLNHNYESAENYFRIVLSNAKTDMEKVEIYEIQIPLLVSLNKLSDALLLTEKALGFVGISILDKTDPSEEIGKIFSYLQVNPVEKVLDLPVLQKEEALVGLRLLALASVSSYISKPEIFGYIVGKMVNLTLEHGLSYLAAYCFTFFSVIVSHYAGNIALGMQIATIAIELGKKFPNPVIQSKTKFFLASMIIHWSKHHNTALEFLHESINIGKDCGDFQFSSYSLNHHTLASLFKRTPLNSMSEIIRKNKLIHLEIKQMDATYMFHLNWQFVENLKGETDNILSLTGKYFDEKKIVDHWKETQNATSLFNYYFLMGWLHFLFGSVDAALGFFRIAESFQAGVLGMPFVPEFNFWYALASLKKHNLLGEENSEHFQKVNSIRELYQVWANNCPANYGHRFYILSVGIELAKGQKEGIEESLDKAIQLAKEHEYIWEEAIANELYAEYWLEREKEHYAKLHIQQAYFLYKCYESKALTEKIERKHPFLKKTKQKRITVNFTSDAGETAEILDLNSIIKANQILSGEIELEKLVVQFIRLILENAGADSGFILYFKDLDDQSLQNLYLIGRGATGQGIQYIEEVPVTDKDIPTSIIQYVMRTKALVNISDVSKSIYSRDSFLLLSKSKSVICYPIISRNIFHGIVYLENHKTTGAFTDAKVELLSILAGQASISIDNARFIQDMMQLNATSRRFVPHEFLENLGKKKFTDFRLGDQIQKEMSVLFSDIRDFTSISEKMTPQENFNFLNSYLSRMSPLVRKNKGFIDKFIGDAVMALFHSPENAIQAAIDMQVALSEFNEERIRDNLFRIQIGIGIHTGKLMMGIVGEEERFEGTVISDSVNLASRIEGLTKNYGVGILVSENSLLKLKDPFSYQYRKVDVVKVKGKEEKISIFQIFEGMPEADFQIIKETKFAFETGIECYHRKEFGEAKQLFLHVKKKNPYDKLVDIYVARCNEVLSKDLAEDWSFVEEFHTK